MTPSCKVLLISSRFPPGEGGAPVVYSHLARYLGPKLSVLAPQRDYVSLNSIPDWQDSDSKLQSRVERIDLLRAPQLAKRPRWTPAILWGLGWHVCQDLPVRRKVLRASLRLVDSVKPAVVCIGDLVAHAWLGMELRIRRRLPVIHYLHGDDISTWTSSRLLAKETSRALAAAEGVVAVSSFAGHLACERGARPERVRVIVNGVDSEHFQPGPVPDEFLKRLDLHGKPVLLSASRLERRKGIDTVIRAMPAIREQVPNAVYLIVGEGSKRLELQQLAASLGLGSCVHVCGPVEHGSQELLYYYRCCNLYLLPNRQMPDGEAEGLGLVFLEAGACAKPVVGGLSGGVCDVVEDGVTGLLVNGDSVEQVSAAAIRILTDPDLARRLGAAGLQQARRSHWKMTAAQFHLFCEEVVAGQVHPTM